LKQVLHYNDGNHALWKDTDTWLRELSLPELMEEYTVWLKKNYDSSYEDGWRKFGTADCFTEKELLNDFLTQKGIL
jgi:hypothetical protein